MKHKTIEIFLFIDALGWKIVNDHHFLTGLLPHRRRIDMQFGYSCSAIPTILSGKTPAEHGHLGLFRFAPEESPFKSLARLAWLFKPASFWNRGRVRHHLSKVLKKFYGFTGYFQLYRMPLWKLKFVDYCEKRNLFVAGGMENIANLHDTLSKKGVNFHISDWHLSDAENCLAAEKAIEKGKNFLFVYTASFDGVLHDRVGDDKAVKEKLDEIQKLVESLYRKAEKYAESVQFTIISDHGMTPLAGTVDIMDKVAQSGLVFGKDYGVCYDSTMARFYYLNDNARSVIAEIMKEFPGHFLSKEEELKYRIYRSDRAFGDEIFLLDAGIQIVPSDMGGIPLNGMHGFAPENEHSFAALLSNRELPEKIEHVADYFNFMIERAEKL
ncbi:MAG: alkaline phosphatase family protein [Lentisphaeria bacterium]|nr:alkaline phosphatase family protein [Lentisphaeria bacterium]